MAAARFHCAMMAHESRSSICTYIMTLHAVVRRSDPTYPSRRYLYGAVTAVAGGGLSWGFFIVFVVIFFFFFFFFLCFHSSKFSGRYAILLLLLYLSQTAEAVEIFANQRCSHTEYKTYLYCIRFARILQYYQSFDYKNDDGATCTIHNTSVNAIDILVLISTSMKINYCKTRLLFKLFCCLFVRRSFLNHVVLLLLWKRELLPCCEAFWNVQLRLPFISILDYYQALEAKRVGRNLKIWVRFFFAYRYLYGNHKRVRRNLKIWLYFFFASRYFNTAQKSWTKFENLDNFFGVGRKSQFDFSNTTVNTK